MNKALGVLLVIILAFLVVAMQFAYTPMPDQTSYKNYRENYAHYLKNPVLERYKHLACTEPEEKHLEDPIR